MGLVTEMFYTDGDIDTSVYFNGVITTALVYDHLTGISAKGHARHNEADEYDQDVGLTLAVSRAMSRLYRKIEKWAVKSNK